MNLNQFRLVVNLESDRIEAYTPFALKDVCKGIPGAKWEPAIKAWTYPAEPMTAQTINRTFPPRIQRTNQFLDLVRTGDIRRAQDDALKASTDLPEIPLTKTPSWMHQRVSFWFSKDKRGAMLPMDMGTGKTKVAIDLIQNAGAKRVLVVCPKKVIRVWPIQLAKHCAIPYRAIPLDRGSVGRRIDDAKLALALAEKSGSNETVFVIINYDAVWRDEMKAFLSRKWDFIVTDESHKIKAPNGAASKAMGALARYADRRLCLTGTPMPHSPLDIYAQYRFLDSSIYGTSYQVFKNTYGIYGGYGGHELIGYRNLEDLNQRFYSIAYRVTKDVLDLPEVQHIERTFELSPKAQAVYEELNEDFIAFASGDEITIPNALVKLLRMAQITSGYLPTDGGGILDLHSDKADELAEVVDEIGADEPIVVFCRFTRDLDAVRKVAHEAGREYMELSGKQDNWVEFQNATGGQIIGVQIQAGGVGIELTRARYCVYYSLDFSLGNFDQSLSRIHRPGQTRPVTYVHLIAEGTVDRKVYNALQNRREVVEAILEEIRQ